MEFNRLSLGKLTDCGKGLSLCCILSANVRSDADGTHVMYDGEDSMKTPWRSSFQRGIHSSSLKVKVKLLSRIRLFATPWAVAYQAPLSMGFSRQEYWSGLLFPSPRDLPDPKDQT